MSAKILVPMLAVVLGGCVAVWGQSYSIDSANADAVTVKYDTNFTTADHIRTLADQSCRRYGKTARLRERNRSIWQIVTVTYDCVAAK